MKVRLHPGILSFFGSLLVRILGVTWRIEWRGEEYLEKARGMSPRVIFSFWHGRLLALSWSHRHRDIQVLASEHYDGDLMGRVIVWLGFGHLKGSSTRGGAKALRDLTAVLKRGLDVGLTIDGPRGPRGMVQRGAVELSRLSSSAVVPVSNTASRRFLFRSWDRFQLPAPFAKVIVSYGEPFIVHGDAGSEEREQFRLRLQDQLNELTSRLDREMGYTGEDAWPHENS